MNSFSDIDEVYVINLPERIDRREAIEKEMLQYGITYTLFNAVKNDNGILGLLDSMKNLFREAISKNQFNIMVLEDDGTFLAPPIDFLNTVIPQLPKDYHCLYLGVNLTAQPTRIKENILKIKKAYCTVAIIYSRQAMEFILSMLDDHITAYDIILMNNLQGMGHCYATYPMLVTQRPGYSNIEKRDLDWGQLMSMTFGMHTKNMEREPMK
jgi:GR25 family glycosyltransferase involved in LPS biosynthesis